MKAELERIWKQSSLNRGTTRYLSGGTEENRKPYIIINCIAAEIRTEHLPSTSLERYLHTSLFDDSKYGRIKLRKLAQAVTLVFGRYPVRLSAWTPTILIHEVLPSPSRKCRDTASKSATAASFDILSNSSFTNHVNILRYVDCFWRHS
jgi:hypothetical protein